MYNVILDKATLQSGREIAATTLKQRYHGNDVPAGGLALMQLFLDQAETRMKSYVSLADSSDRSIFALAKSAITSLTTAAEFVNELQGPFRIGYLDIYAEIRTQDHVRFLAEVEHMLSLMSEMIAILKKKRTFDGTPQEIEREHHNRCLMYTIHLANLAISVTQPERNIYRHPSSKTWLSKRAACLRNLSGSLIELAKLDEAESKK